MSRKKVTPVGLYLRELKRMPDARSIDIIGASNMYRHLSATEKEYYVVLSKKINEKHAAENTSFTTQRDTIGTNLREVTECQSRFTKWEQDVLNIIKNIAVKDEIMDKKFVVVQVGGVYFSRADDCHAGYAASEISFIRFTLKDGIKDTLILFPECVKIAIGYRESLYEDLEEAVGWRPDTFKNNHSLEDCSKQIRQFFDGIYDPIYVSSKGQQEEVGMSLYNLYGEIDQRCPWIHSLQDWGQHCTIYRLDSLISSIINRSGKSVSSKEIYSSADVREHWLKMNVNTASECCERHQQYGLPNQCPHDIVTKNLYSSFLLMYTLYKDEMCDIRDMVSEDFYNNLDFILKKDEPECPEREKNHNQSSHYWNNYVFDKTGIEEIINRLEAISVKENTIKKSFSERPCVMGRGRGTMKAAERDVAPGEAVAARKLKLPDVIC